MGTAYVDRNLVKLSVRLTTVALSKSAGRDKDTASPRLMQKVNLRYDEDGFPVV